jgi:hypothetical protein
MHAWPDKYHHIPASGRVSKKKATPIANPVERQLRD